MFVKCQPSGDILSLDETLRLDGGGEGVIYRLPHNPDLVAKIYHSGKMNAERAGKLRAMMENAPDDPVRGMGHASIAWPVELVYERDGNQKMVGFLMPRLQNARRICDIYDVTERHARFPLFTYDSLCRTACNLASAVRAIHQSGYVIGDVNELNILVTQRALVTLVDTDSFQVTERTSGRVYRCPVGTDMFTPPELLGKNFEEIDRSQAHDLFGLAVLFFQLLMEGTRPFACSFPGVADPPEYFECLAKGYFPYVQDSMGKPSPWSPPFEMLHPDLQKLFRQCFVDGHSDPRQRPDAETWYHALRESEQTLVSCSRNIQHHYFSHCPVCPWCERARQVSSALDKPNWDPFPTEERAHEFAHYNYAAARSSASSQWSPVYGSVHGQASVPVGAPPTPSSFSASANTVAIGQAVTLQWAVPHAQTVRITDQSGRHIFAGNSANGFVTIYPTRTGTYHLATSGVGINLPNPITVSVTQVPLPVALKQPQLELHQPISLRAEISLNEIAVKLSSASKLKSYLPLSKYNKLKRASVGLKNYHHTL
jgi:serine/threonine protein kinase